MQGFEKEIERIRILQYDCLNDENLNKLAIRWDILDNYTRSECIRQLQQRLVTIKNSSINIKDINIHILPIRRTISANNVLSSIDMENQVLANLYKAGQIDQEFGVKDVGKVAETIAAGKFGMEFGAQWNPMYPLIGSYNNDPNADWIGYSLASCDDQTVHSPNKFAATRYWAVRKDYAHPEALIKLFNMHIEMCWGPTGDFNKYYMPVENGSVGVWKFSPVTPFSPTKNLDAFVAIDNHERTKRGIN